MDAPRQLNLNRVITTSANIRMVVLLCLVSSSWATPDVATHDNGNVRVVATAWPLDKNSDRGKWAPTADSRRNDAANRDADETSLYLTSNSGSPSHSKRVHETATLHLENAYYYPRSESTYTFRHSTQTFPGSKSESTMLNSSAATEPPTYEEDLVCPIHPWNCSSEPPSFFATSGEIILVAAACLITKVKLECRWTVRAPPRQFLTVTVETFSQSKTNIPAYLWYHDGSSDGSRVMGHFRSNTVTEPRHSASNVVHFLLLIEANTTFPEMRITFESSNTPSYSRLDVTFLSNQTGFVQSPMFDGYTPYGSFLFDEYQIIVPAGFVIMITFISLDLDCSEDTSVKLYSVDRTGTRTLDSVYCEFHTRGKFKGIVKNTSLVVQLQTDSTFSSTGFKLAFSLHEISKTPKRDSGSGLFNCSAPWYDSFRHHLECDLVQDCTDNEDERECALHSQARVGYSTMLHKYYRLFPYEQLPVRSWEEAASACRKRGSYLATMYTQSDEEAMKKLLHMREKSRRFVYLGLVEPQASVPVYYQNIWRGLEGTTNFYMTKLVPFWLVSRLNENDQLCHILKADYTWYIIDLHACRQDAITEGIGIDTVCEYKSQLTSTRNVGERIHFAKAKNYWNKGCGNKHLPRMKQCPGGHVTHQFMSCDGGDACGIHSLHKWATCETTSSSFLHFVCPNKLSIPFTVLCDFRADCADGSDENFCVHPECTESEEACGNGQCIDKHMFCDGRQNCANGADESGTLCRPNILSRWCEQRIRIPAPAVIHFDGYGDFTQEALNDSRQCPETHFLCPDSYCLPVYLRCNQVYDCPGWEDEADCSTYACPGYYRCRHSAVCLHADHVCDGVFQCPQQDDELLCGLSCPEGCQCQGLAFVCATPFHVDEHRHVRYVDASGSGLTPEHFVHSHYLIYLRLSRCGLDHVPILNLPNLQTLDLSYNAILTIEPKVIFNLSNLRQLILSHNPFKSLVQADAVLEGFHRKLEYIDFSFTHRLRVIDKKLLSPFPHIQALNLSFSRLEIITEDSFGATVNLSTLDIRHTRLTSLSKEWLKDLERLDELHAGHFSFCCKIFLPDSFDVRKCFAPLDKLSSCENLLAADLHRTFVLMAATLAVLGNMATFFYNLTLKGTDHPVCSKIFSMSLNGSDFSMGLYLTIIGAADALYRGDYVSYDAEWRSSLVCRFAGFLYFTSRYVSTWSVCLITLEQMLVIFLSKTGRQLQGKATLAACVAVWVAGLLLAAIPLLPVTSGWEYYNETGICIPLSVNKFNVRGYIHFLRVRYIMGLALSAVAGLGQIWIWTRQTSDASSARPTSSTHVCKIVLLDVLCWIPSDCYGIWVLAGLTSSDPVDVGLVLFLEPLYSALNPLMAMNAFYSAGRRRREKRKIMHAMISKRLKNDTRG